MSEQVDPTAFPTRATDSNVGRALADALTMFSIDIVRLCAQYLFPTGPESGARPTFLLAFGIRNGAPVSGRGAESAQRECTAEEAAAAFLAYVCGHRTVGPAKRPDPRTEDMITCVALAAHRRHVYCWYRYGCVVFRVTDGAFLGHNVQRPSADIRCYGSAFPSRYEMLYTDLGRGTIFASDAAGDRGSIFHNVDRYVAPVRLMGLAIDGDRHVFAADIGNHCIRVWSRDGTFLTSFGRKGAAEGELDRPSGLALNSASQLCVVDTGNDRVQVFDLHGKFLRKFGARGSGAGELHAPCGVAVDAYDNVFVCETGNHRVQCFRADGTFVTTFGSRGPGDGQFNAPMAICIDPRNGRIFAGGADGRVQVFCFAEPVCYTRSLSVSTR